MSIVRIAKREHYTIISNEAARDSSLSWEARGVLLYLLSHDDEWRVYRQDLVKSGPAGREKIQRILKELDAAGYIQRVRVRDQHGHIGYETQLFERPQTGKPRPAEPRPAKPSTVNPPLLITDQRKTERRKTESRNAAPKGAGADAPLDPDKLLFDTGLKALRDSGKTTEMARSILGRWRREFGDGAVISAIGRTLRVVPSDPIAFMRGCLRQGSPDGDGGAARRKFCEGIGTERRRRPDAVQY